MSTCNKLHRSYPAFENLPEYQGGTGRHKCCGCAFAKGLLDGFEGLPRNPQLNQLPESQAGSVRHRDANSAYDLGFDTGTELFNDFQTNNE
jgi:hypothetical protein